MKASHRWLVELSGVDASPEEVAEALTSLGLEVENKETFGRGLDHVVVAQVRANERVPGKDKLTLVTVFDGANERKVICGAPNVPELGRGVVLAKPGAVLPGGFVIAEREVGGVVSSGMLCSETELGIGEGAAGIIVLCREDALRPGCGIAEALALEDTVYEIGLTPNRPDCLGHIGLARELALAFGKVFRVPPPGWPKNIVGGIEDLEIAEGLPLVGDARPADTLTLVDQRPGVPCLVPIRIEDPRGCPRYAGGVIQGVVIGPSPFWLRYRLFVLGVRSIDNVVDVTNLVLHEAGHPIHAFDLARLRGPEIVVRGANEGETMKTLDGVERTFARGDLLICDGEGPVAVAGVMGGLDSEIRADTRDVLIEVAYFDPRCIRRTSRRLGLHTDSSHRFERGVDPNGVPWALRRAVSLMCSLASGAASPVARDCHPTSITPKVIRLDAGHPARLLGRPVDEGTSRRVLEAIGCDISPAEDGAWRVHAPTWRPDLGRPEDLIEEIARVIGYDEIPTELPRVLPSGRGVAPRLRLARRLREAAADIGLLEAVNFSFVSREELARSRVDTDGVMLANPLSEERSVMRTSLLPGLLGDVARARRRQARAVTLFELARTYRGVGEALPAEPLTLAIVLAGPRVGHVGSDGPYDFYDGKGALASILEAALGAPLTASGADALEAPHLHPRRRATLAIGDAVVGHLGEIHPDVCDAWDLDVRVVYGELSVDRLLEIAASRGVPQAQVLPRFPSVARDVSLCVDEAAEAATVARVLRIAGGDLVEEIELIDVYRGESIPERQKSLTLRVTYRDPQATLTDRAVDEAHARLLKAAKQQLGADVRQ